MSSKPNEKLSDELLDTPLNEGNRLEKMKKLTKDNLFYVIAATGLAAGTSEYLINYPDFDLQLHLDGNRFLQTPTLYFAIGFIGLLFIGFKDGVFSNMTKEKMDDSLLDIPKKDSSSLKRFILGVYGAFSLLSSINSFHNQKLFNEGLEDGISTEIGDPELRDNVYYREGFEEGERRVSIVRPPVS